jgi:hypothetical protein
MNFAKRLCDETIERALQTTNLDISSSVTGGEFDIDTQILLGFLNERLAVLNNSELQTLLKHAPVMLAKECNKLCDDMKDHDYIFVSHRYILYGHMVNVAKTRYERLCEAADGYKYY